MADGNQTLSSEKKSNHAKCVDDVEKKLNEANLNENCDSPVEESAENKLTQTDRLNKKLLTSFLDRLNQGDNSVSFAITKESSNDDIPNCDD